MLLERFLVFFHLSSYVILAQYNSPYKYNVKVPNRMLQDRLDRVYRNKECCDRNVRKCCKPLHKPSSFEVRALLARCSNAKCQRFSFQSAVNKSEMYVKETDPVHFPKCKTRMHDCEKKLKLTIKIANKGIVSSKFQYVIIDHVYDPLTETRAKLLHPYVLRIKQTPVIQKYDLMFEHMINSKAKEEVHNKNELGYVGCSTDPKNATCGAMKYKGKSVPYSTGFCCSCDHQKNLQNQPHDESEEANAPSKHSLPDGQNNIDIDSLLRKPVYKREVRQKRGGQDCKDTSYSPAGVNRESYHDSAHCLKFSDLWYYVYRLRHPIIQHTVQIRVFEKFEDYYCNTRWRDLTADRTLEVNSQETRCCSNNEPTVTVEYVPLQRACKLQYSLKPGLQRLLIPELHPGFEKYPELKGGPAEYLVVPYDLISPEGKTCNKAGVSFEGFYKQPNRCSVPQGSCLSNQPADLWTRDHEAEAEGKRGSYFLKYFAQLTDNPVKKNCSTYTSISLYYTKVYKNVLEMDIKADMNAILRPNSFAKITEVYTDWSCPHRISLTIKIVNSGLIASVFFIRLLDCPMSIPATFNNIASKAVLIPPQHQHVFNIHIESTINYEYFFCSIEVVNMKYEIIALRRIRFEKFDRCLCMWHCKCACLFTDGAIKCIPLEINSFNTAGFQGGQPVAVHVMDYTLLDEVISILGYLLLFLFMTLLIMGVTKAMIGWCAYPAVGLWGLDALLNIRRTVCNKKECVCTLTSDELPVSKSTLFCINVIFFFIYPFAVSFNVLRNLCFPKFVDENEVCVFCSRTGNEYTTPDSPTEETPSSKSGKYTSTS